MLDTVAMVLGYIVLVVAALLPLNISWRGGEYWMVSYFGFGVLYAYGDKTITNLSKLRKVERQKLFIEAPQWFNKHVYNFGVRAK